MIIFLMTLVKSAKIVLFIYKHAFIYMYDAEITFDLCIHLLNVNYFW